MGGTAPGGNAGKGNIGGSKPGGKNCGRPGNASGNAFGSGSSRGFLFELSGGEIATGPLDSTDLIAF